LILGTQDLYPTLLLVEALQKGEPNISPVRPNALVANSPTYYSLQITGNSLGDIKTNGNLKIPNSDDVAGDVNTT
jgi:hypothetical protein